MRLFIYMSWVRYGEPLSNPLQIICLESVKCKLRIFWTLWALRLASFWFVWSTRVYCMALLLGKSSSFLVVLLRIDNSYCPLLTMPFRQRENWAILLETINLWLSLFQLRIFTIIISSHSEQIIICCLSKNTSHIKV